MGMTLSEILAKVTGLETKITDLEKAKSDAVASHADLATKLTAAEAKLTAIAEAPPAPKSEPDSQDKLKAAHDALQKVLSEIASLLAAGGKKDDEPEPEAEGDGEEGEMSDPEAKAIALGKKALAAVKTLQTEKKKAADAQVTAAAAAQIARIGLTEPVKTAKTPEGSKPEEVARENANSAWFKNLRTT